MKSRKSRIKKSKSMIVFQCMACTLLTLGAVICVVPFLLILSGSLSDNAAILREGYSLLPRSFSLAAYETIFKAPEEILQAYKMTIFYTVVGTCVGLAMITLTSFVISRKEFKYRNQVSFLIYFTTLFGGGLIPWYLMYTNVLNMKGTTFPIWFPGVMSPFLVVLMRTSLTDSVPDAITESATPDGAGQFTIFYPIVLPALGPGLATLGLFLALGHWHIWYRSSLFFTSQKTWDLQFYLSNMLNMSASLKQMAQSANIPVADMPTQAVKLAMAVVVTGPVLLFYPFVQRFFVSGITVGAVKG